MKDYKEKYEDALKRAKAIIEIAANKDEAIGFANTIFPELKESEDARIRKELLEHCINRRDGIQVCADASDYRRWAAWLEKQGEPQDKGEISDGYHTFNELYYYRMLYNAAFFNQLPKEWVHKSKKHHDGEECFGGGWFIVMANLPTGQISNHYELTDWDLFCIPEKEIADEWDGHTPQEAAERLHKYLLEKQGEQKPTWSEEDELRFKQAIYVCHRNGYTDVENWLKSLKPQSHWKPTDEQMSCFKQAIDLFKMKVNDDVVLRYLNSLYNDLKKL